MEESKKYFEAAIAEFEALRDDANVALVVNNLGLLERLGALYFELVLQRPHSPQEDAFFQRAVARFEAAQRAAAKTPYPVCMDACHLLSMNWTKRVSYHFVYTFRVL